MGKSKRHEKPHKRHSPYQTSKAGVSGIKRRQHSQNGKLSKPKQSTVPPHSTPKHPQQPAKHRVPFTPHDRVLLIGEGDFSFAASLAQHHGVKSIIATSYDDSETLKTKYPQVDDTLRILRETAFITSAGKPDGIKGKSDEWSGFSSESNDEADVQVESVRSRPETVTVLHGIDATSLSKAHKKMLAPHAPFTKIVFNFPHTGGLSTDVNRQVRANQELLVNFFNAAKPLLATKARPARFVVHDKDQVDDREYLEGNGEESEAEDHTQALSTGRILVTLFEGEPYTLWNIRDLARHCGLQVIESFKFDWMVYPGYKHARTIGEISTGKDRSDQGKRKGAWRGEERDARCYVMGLRDEKPMHAKNTKRKGNDDSDDSD